MRRLWALAVGLTLIVGVRAGFDDPPKSPAEELKQLQSQVADAQKKVADLRQKVQKEEDADEKKKLQEELQKASKDASQLMTANQTKAIKLAKADPKSETGLDAAIWGMISLRSNPSELLALISAVTENHAASKKISAMMPPLQMLIGMPGEQSDKALALVEMIVAKNPEKSVQASAIYAVADFYKNRSEPRGRKPPAEADEFAKKAELGFERLEKNYGDVKLGSRTYGTLAKSALFELRNLRVGKTAPEVEGEDADGVKFKLSDYRGKVVMLDFWGHW